MKKILLRQDAKLQVGDYFLEQNRFDLKDYCIYKIIDKSTEDYAKLEVIEIGPNSTSRLGATPEGIISGPKSYKNSKWLMYELPTFKVLYGSKS